MSNTSAAQRMSLARGTASIRSSTARASAGSFSSRSASFASANEFNASGLNDPSSWASRRPWAIAARASSRRPASTSSSGPMKIVSIRECGNPGRLDRLLVQFDRALRLAACAQHRDPPGRGDAVRPVRAGRLREVAEASHQVVRDQDRRVERPARPLGRDRLLAGRHVEVSHPRYRTASIAGPSGATASTALLSCTLAMSK